MTKEKIKQKKQKKTNEENTHVENET